MGERYFVRSRDDAPEKGPYSPDQLAKSLAKNLLGAKATARREDSEEWLPLRDVVAAFPSTTKVAKRRGAKNDEHALASVPRSPGVHPVVWLGVIVGLLGVGLTLAFAATNASGMWPVGLILGGVYIAVRGVIRGPVRMEDE